MSERSRYDTEWMKMLLYNLGQLEKHEPRSVSKLILHDAKEAIEFLLARLAEAEPNPEPQ